MSLVEQRVLKQVTMLPQSNTINIQWANQIVRDGSEIVSETYERAAYSQEDKDAFISAVDGGAAYATAMGW